MDRQGQRFHPRSPVQPGRRSPLPFLFLALFAIFMIWKLRDTWVDAVAPVEKHAGSPDTEGTDQRARGNLAALFSADDYPSDALRKGEQGRTTVQLDIDRDGRVSRCNVVSSSGSSSLDNATCSILAERARFTPARDSNGNRVEDSHTQTIVWQLQ